MFHLGVTNAALHRPASTQWGGNPVLMGSLPPCKKRAPAPSQEQYEDRNFSVGAGDILSEAFPFAGRCDGDGGGGGF